MRKRISFLLCLALLVTLLWATVAYADYTHEDFQNNRASAPPSASMPLEESPIYPPIVLKPNPAPVEEQPLQPTETEPEAEPEVEPEIEEPAVPETGDISPALPLSLLLALPAALALCLRKKVQ